MRCFGRTRREELEGSQRFRSGVHRWTPTRRPTALSGCGPPEAVDQAAPPWWWAGRRQRRRLPHYVGAGDDPACGHPSVRRDRVVRARGCHRDGDGGPRRPSPRASAAFRRAGAGGSERDVIRHRNRRRAQIPTRAGRSETAMGWPRPERPPSARSSDRLHGPDDSRSGSAALVSPWRRPGFGARNHRPIEVRLEGPPTGRGGAGAVGAGDLRGRPRRRRALGAQRRDVTDRRSAHEASSRETALLEANRTGLRRSADVMQWRHRSPLERSIRGRRPGRRSGCSTTERA